MLGELALTALTTGKTSVIREGCQAVPKADPTSNRGLPLAAAAGNGDA